MLVCAAVCPHPPALVPAVSRAAAGQLDEVRAAAVSAVRRLQASRPDLLVCVGGGVETRRFEGGAGGTLHDFGVEAAFGGSPPTLPLALTVAAYLVQEASDQGCDLYQSVASTAAAEVCGAVGAELAGLADRVALLVMGDGSARRTSRSPGPFDERAVGFDAEVARALTAADPDALLAIDRGLADELWVAGSPAWQVLAGALATSPADWTGELIHASAPLGVGYLVVHLRSR